MTAGADFLSSWFSGCPGLIELRHLPSRDRSFHEGPTAAAKAAAQLDRRGGAVYFGVAPRDGKGGKKENIVAIPGLWADIDFKATPRGRAEELLRTFPLRPWAIIFSGGGFHVYWRFKEPAGREDIPRVEAILRGLARALDGDLGATDASRVLRPPGTLNRKKEYDSPVRVQVIESNPEAQYNISDFDFLADAEPEAPAREGKADRTLLPANLLPVAIDGCAAMSRIVARAREERHLSHGERIALANLCAVFDGGLPWATETVFPMLSDYDARYTGKQIASLLGRPPLCVNEALCGGREKCAVIVRAGGTSPVKLATWGEEAPKQDPKILVYETLDPTPLPDLILADIPDPEPFISGLLYPETVLVVGGLVKVRKTWTAIHLGLSGAAAASFLGHAIRRKLRVLYIGGEGSHRAIRKRFMLALGFIDGLQEEDLGRVGIVSSLGRIKLDTPAGEKWLQRVSEGYDIIIIDPYYRFLSAGDENSHADQRAIFDVLDRLKAKGKGIVIVHHLRKPQGSDAGAAELRGAGLDGYADSILLISRKKTGADERFLLKYILRNDEPVDDVDLAANGPLLKVAEPLPPKVTAADLISAIDEAGGAIAGTTLKRTVKEATEAAKHEVDEAVKAATQDGVIGWRPNKGRGQGRLYYVKTRPEDAV